MKNLLRSLIFFAAALGLHATPNDIIIVQQNNKGNAQIQTIIPGTVNQLLGVNSLGKTTAFANTADVVLSIVDYGALLDGQTDIAPAVAAAIAACPPGGIVYFPSSPLGYMWKTQVVCAQSNITFQGFGVSILTDTPAHARKLSFTGQSNITVSGLNFDGDFPTGSGVGNSAGFLEFTNCTNVVVNSCGFANTEYDGIFGQGSCAQFTIYDNEFSFYFGGVIFYSTGTTAQPVSLDISGNRFQSGNATTSTSGSGSIKIVGLGTASGSINNNLQGQYTIARNIISNTAGQMGIECNGSVNHAVVADNTIYGPGFGISFAGSAHGAITGNTVKAPVNYGIEVAAACLDISATGNVIDGTSTAGAGANAFGWSIINSTDVTITGGAVSSFTVDLYAQDSAGTPVVNLAVNGVTFTGTINSGEEVYIKYVTGMVLNACTFIGNSNMSAFIGLDQADGVNSHILIENNKFLGVSGNQAISVVNSASNALTYLMATGNDTSGVTSIPSGWWNLPSALNSNLKFFRVFGNVDNGNAPYDDAFQVSAYTYTGSQANTSYFYFLAEGALNGVDATSGAATFQLPDAVNQAGQGWTATFQKADATANAVTLTTTSSQTINGASTYVLPTQYARVQLMSNGSNWVVMNATPSPVLPAVALGNLTGTVNINWNLGTVFYGTLTGNTTFTFSNPVPGLVGVVRVYQTGTNAFTVTWPTVSWPNNTAPTMTTGTAAHDTTTFIYQNSTYDGSSVQAMKP
jgi:hypothetical protein